MTALLNLCLPNAWSRLGQPHKPTADAIIAKGHMTERTQIDRQELIELFHDKLRPEFEFAEQA